MSIHGIAYLLSADPCGISMSGLILRFILHKADSLGSLRALSMTLRVSYSPGERVFSRSLFGIDFPCPHELGIAGVIPLRAVPMLLTPDLRCISHARLADDDKWLKPWKSRTISATQVLPCSYELDEPVSEIDPGSSFGFVRSVASNLLTLASLRVRLLNAPFFDGDIGFQRRVFALASDLAVQFGHPPTEQKTQFRLAWMGRTVDGSLCFS
jgi:hypothetical protein